MFIAFMLNTSGKKSINRDEKMDFLSYFVSY